MSLISNTRKKPTISMRKKSDFSFLLNNIEQIFYENWIKNMHF